MKTLNKLVGLISLSIIPYLGHTQVQTVYPSNSSFDYPGSIPGVPNHIAPPLWNRVDPNTTPDVSTLGITNYGFVLNPQFNSSDGGQWLRSIDLPNYNGGQWREGVYTTVSDLVIGRVYTIHFEQAIVKGQIGKKGSWKVSLGNQSQMGPMMTPPFQIFSMSNWQNVSLGPFTATATSMTMKLEAIAEDQGVLGQWDGCDLALDGIYLTGLNTPPVLNDKIVEICEESTNNSLVIKLKATDPDGDQLKYSIISGNTNNTFSINGNNGRIKVADASQLDPDITPTYNLIVEVDDGYGGKDQATITININDTPEFTTSTTDISCTSLGSITITPTKGIAPYEYSTDGGQNFQSSNSFTGLPAGDYDIVLKDSKTCMGTDMVTISSVASLSVDNITTTKATCTVGGQITLTVSGGTPTIEYSKDNGVNWQTSNVFLGLPAGTYKITIRESGGCIVEQNVTIEVIPPIIIDTLISTNFTCSAAGTITVNATAGATPIEYSKDGGSNWQLGNVFPGLAAGNYTIFAKDANGCTISEKDTIYSIPSFVVDSITTTNETCGSKGSIIVFTTGGTDPLEYSKDNGVTFQLSNNFSGLDGGVYKIEVKDANGCPFKQDVTVNTTPPFTLDGIVTDVTCAGLGTITVNISGPTATMEYSIDDGLTFQDSNFFSDLLAKDYDIVVRDFNTCQKKQTVTVNNVPAFNVDSIKSVNESCFNKGSIEIFTTGGTAPVEYSIDDSVTFSIKDTFNNLTPGVYHIVIKDKNTCTFRDTITIKNATLAILDSVTIVNDSCNACQGEITIHATGPGTLNYSIDGGSTKHTSNKFTGLCAANYSILIITGTCNTPSTANVLNVGSIADAGINPVDSVCVTDSPFALIPITLGGSWNGTGIDNITGVFNPQSAGPGTHKITYTIGGACGNNDSIKITVVDTVNPKINDVPIMCITEDTIQLSSQTLGGTWSGTGVNTSGIFDPSSSGKGEHKIYYTVPGICINIDSILIEVKDTINPQLEPAGPFCINGNPIQFNSPNPDGVWVGTGISPSGIFTPSNAGVGSHEITLSVSGICIDSDTILVEVVDTLTPLISEPGLICSTLDTIKLLANIPGGVWSGTGITDSINGIFDPKEVDTGEHTITYTLTGVCKESTSTVLVIKSPLNVNLTMPAIPNCLFSDSLELPFSISGTGIDSVEWNFGDSTVSIYNVKNIAHLYTKFGNYNGYVKIIDNVCNLDSTINFNIELNPASKMDASIAIANNPIICSPYLGVFTGFAGAKEHQWNFGDLTSSIEKDPQHYYENTGSYTVTYIATNTDYCVPKDTVILNVDVLRNKPLLNAAKLVAPEPCSYVHGNLPIDILYEGISTDSLIIDWGDGSVVSNISKDNIFIKQNYTYITEGEYVIKITAIDLLCNYDTTIYIPITHKRIVTDDAIMAPNIFTPNKDGINDEFKLFYHNRKDYDIYQDILDYEVNVFDRWGNQIYNSKKVQIEFGDEVVHWDGSSNFGDQAADGVYFYIVTYRAQCYDDGNKYKIRRLKGHLTIQR